ncbi:MAG: hypothetical protein AAF191_11015 [Verrucomicrobiota bacterium]
MASAARNLYERNQDALVVVTAQVTVNFETDGGTLPSQEQTTQTLGTIIDGKGLIMISNSALDPSVGMKGQRGRPVGEEEFATVTKASAYYRAIQVNLADGSMYHAAMIDRVPDLDLAFLLADQAEVQKRKGSLPRVNLGNAAAGVSIGEDIIGMARSNSVYGYIPTVVPMNVSAISKREPTYYLTTVGAVQGMPIFSKGGSFVGLVVQRVVSDQRTGVLGVLEAKALNQRVKLTKAKHKAFR